MLEGSLYLKWITGDSMDILERRGGQKRKRVLLFLFWFKVVEFVLLGRAGEGVCFPFAGHKRYILCQSPGSNSHCFRDSSVADAYSDNRYLGQ